MSREQVPDLLFASLPSRMALRPCMTRCAGRAAGDLQVLGAAASVMQTYITLV